MKSTISSKQTRKSSKSRAKNPSKKTTSKLPQHPEQIDTFSKAIQDQERRHLIEEHELQLQVQEDAHRARLGSIQSQLQIQLYRIWNEAWLQRKKSFDQGFKEWLKVFAS